MRSKTFVTRTKYKYTVLFGAVTITECRTRESVVRIPQTIKDYPVTSIGNMAFGKCAETLEEVTVPNGVEEICEGAFRDCVALKRVNLPEGLRKIEDDAFAGCCELSEVELPEGLTAIGNSAFKGCGKLMDINIPGTVERIGDNAFAGCGITEITFPNNLRSLGFSAFACPGLKKITVLGDIYNVGHYAFSNETERFHKNMELVISDNVTGIKYICHELFCDIPREQAALEFPLQINLNGGSINYTGTGEQWSELTERNMVRIEGNIYLGKKNSPYFYTAFGGEATISGCDKSASGDLVIPSEINGYKVTAIRDHAFEGCSGIESVVVPASVTRIGCCAFERCGLEKIVLPDELREIASDTFAFCKNLREIKLPDSLLHIGIDAFRGCSALEAVTFPEKLLSVDGTAYKDCDNIRELTMLGDIKDIGMGVFSGTNNIRKITISKNVSSLREIWSALRLSTDDDLEPCDLDELNYTGSKDEWRTLLRFSEIRLSDTKIRFGTKSGPYRYVLHFDEAEIIDCDKEISGRVEIPSEFDGYKVGCIGKEALCNCRNIESLVIPHSVKRIDDNAFSGCEKLIKVTVLYGTEKIGDEAFSGCENLMSIDLPESIKQIGCGAFEGCSALTMVSLPSDISNIRRNLFRDCRNLTRVDIPNGVRCIDDAAFFGCGNLVRADIPDSVDMIEQSAFERCSSLREIIVPDSVRSLGGWAFSGCEQADISISASLAEKVFSASDGFDLELYRMNYDFFDAPKDSCRNYCRWLFEHSTFRKMKGADKELLHSAPYSYTLNEHGDACIVDCDRYISGNVEIPDELDGHKVTAIGDYAFMGCEHVENINIPESVTAIGNSAFYYLRLFYDIMPGSLRINIPAGERILGANALPGCYEICYRGTSADWENIQNHETVHRGVICSDGIKCGEFFFESD